MTMVEAQPKTAAAELDVNGPAIDYALCDADEHYYEAEDALTRYLDPKYRRAVRWIEMGGRKTLLINDRLVTVVPNPTYDPVGVPGSIETYFRALFRLCFGTGLWIIARQNEFELAQEHKTRA